MPANRALSGPSALKSRRARPGAESACGAACSAPPSGRLAQPRAVPAQPFSRMMRAARLRDARSPRRRSPAKTFGAPQMRRLASQTSEVSPAGSASRGSRPPGPRERRA